MANSNAKSEFGGGRGRIAPAPHDPKNHTAEMARLMKMTEPTDAIDNEDSVLLREWDMEKRTGEIPS